MAIQIAKNAIVCIIALKWDTSDEYKWNKWNENENKLKQIYIETFEIKFLFDIRNTTFSDCLRRALHSNGLI